MSDLGTAGHRPPFLIILSDHDAAEAQKRGNGLGGSARARRYEKIIAARTCLPTRAANGNATMASVSDKAK